MLSPETFPGLISRSVRKDVAPIRALINKINCLATTRRCNDFIAYIIHLFDTYKHTTTDAERDPVHKEILTLITTFEQLAVVLESQANYINHLQDALKSVTPAGLLVLFDNNHQAMIDYAVYVHGVRCISNFLSYSPNDIYPDLSPNIYTKGTLEARLAHIVSDRLNIFCEHNTNLWLDLPQCAPCIHHRNYIKQVHHEHLSPILQAQNTLVSFLHANLPQNRLLYTNTHPAGDSVPPPPTNLNHLFLAALDHATLPHTTSPHTHPTDTAGNDFLTAFTLHLEALVATLRIHADPLSVAYTTASPPLLPNDVEVYMALIGDDPDSPIDPDIALYYACPSEFPYTITHPDHLRHNIEYDLHPVESFNATLNPYPRPEIVVDHAINRFTADVATVQSFFHCHLAALKAAIPTPIVSNTPSHSLYLSLLDLQQLTSTAMFPHIHPITA